MMKAVHFDEALPAALNVLGRQFGEILPETTLVRDALGILCIVLPDEALAKADDWNRLAAALHEALARYSPGEARVLLRIGDLIDPDEVVQSPDRVRLPDFPNTWLLDRLQTNQDWLRKPLALPPPLPTAVAFSIKGGVGRTTAFTLWAWHLARLGKNVVVVDLDLEAPGVSAVLLDEDRLPDYGLVDWLVEALVGQAGILPLQECLGECGLAGDEPGRILVLPAFGKKTREYVSKLGRCYMPTLSDQNGQFLGLAERLQFLLQQLAQVPSAPNAVLLDARAGLHDISSAALTRLGAEVFMFARDDYQSWQSYRLLFEHLRSALSVQWGMPDNDLRWRLGMVAAQVEPTEAAKRRFIERSYETWLGLYDEEGDADGDIGQVFSRDDDGPHQPLFIDFDPRVRSFDLIDPMQRPDWQAIEQAFGGFFERATARLFPRKTTEMTAARFRFDAPTFRLELMSLPETSAWENLTPPKLTEIHLPPTHGKALSPDCSIVEGMRGAGKSFWTAVLANENTRKYVYDMARLPGLANVVVGVGFGLDMSNESFPNRTRIESLLNGGHAADAVWRAVLLRHALKSVNRALPFADEWEDAVCWVESQPAATDKYMADCDRTLFEQGRVLLLLFDSLDRLADDWVKIRLILSAALKLCLECRTRRAIRLKFFLRPDMVEEEDAVWRFADSSKLLHSRARLDWRPDELYGVILLHLANSAAVGADFRQALQQKAQVQWQAIDDAYPLPKGLREPIQDVIEALAGPWVGRSATRGKTYTWIPTHLSDAKGRLSPRSILLAFKEAAVWTDRHQQEHDLPLHFQGVQQGVVKASEIRISEIKEDYPWAEPLLRALKGVTVPLAFDDVRERWTKACVQESLDAATGRLPPRRYSSDPARNLRALMEDLVELAVFYPTQDIRFNMPDIFRVGFGIKRKGGVKPLR